MGMNNRLMRPRASGGFSPKNISGLQLWLDAADSSTVTLNSGNVSEWLDKSGNGRNAAQTTAANQPAYTQNGLNGLPVLSGALPNSGNHFDMTINAWSYSAANTAMFVFKATSFNEGIYQRGPLNDSPRAAVQNLPLDLLCTRGGTYDAQTSSAISYTSGTWSIGGTLVDTSLGRVYLNGQYGTDTTDSQTFSGNLSLRIMALTATIYPLTGGLAEFIYWDKLLTSGEVALVAKYLSKKWGVALS